MLLVIFFDRWTGFVRDACLCRRSRREQDPLGDEDFLPDKHYEDYDAGTRNHNGKRARDIRESASLSNIRYPTGVFFGDGVPSDPGRLVLAQVEVVEEERLKRESSVSWTGPKGPRFCNGSPSSRPGLLGFSEIQDEDSFSRY